MNRNDKKDYNGYLDTVSCPLEFIKIEALGLPTRVTNTLRDEGFETVRDIIDQLEEDERAFIGFRGLGRVGYENILEKLDSFLETNRYFAETYSFKIRQNTYNYDDFFGGNKKDDGFWGKKR